jgi:hypothetical protein
MTILSSIIHTSTETCSLGQANFLQPSIRVRLGAVSGGRTDDNSELARYFLKK